jgi:hypothetical protein
MIFWPLEGPKRFLSYYWVLWLVEGLYTLLLSLGYRACLRRDSKNIFTFTLAHGFMWCLFNVFIFVLMTTSTEKWLLPKNLSLAEIVNVVLVGTWMMYHDLLLFTSCLVGLWACKYLSLSERNLDEENGSLSSYKDIRPREIYTDSDLTHPVPIVTVYPAQPQVP